MKFLIILMTNIIFIANVFSQSINDSIVKNLSSFLGNELNFSVSLESIHLEEILKENSKFQVYLFYSEETMPVVDYILVKNIDKYSIVNAEIRDFVMLLTELENEQSDFYISGTDLLKCVQYISKSCYRNILSTQDSLSDNMVSYEFNYSYKF